MCYRNQRQIWNRLKISINLICRVSTQYVQQVAVNKSNSIFKSVQYNLMQLPHPLTTGKAFSRDNEAIIHSHEDSFCVTNIAIFTGIDTWQRAFSQINETITTSATAAENGSILTILGADTHSPDALFHSGGTLARLYLVHHSRK